MIGNGIDTDILRSMETTSPTYRIATKSGTVIADNMPRSAPVIQLHEGVLSKGNLHPKDLEIGKSTVVAYPLIEGRLICRVTRTDGIIPIVNMGSSFDFVEPDPIPTKGKSESKEQSARVRRGRGRNASS